MLIIMNDPQLILAFFWPLKVIKILFTYFNDKIKPKPSPDGNLSPNTILFSNGLHCIMWLMKGPKNFEKIAILKI